MKRIEKIEGTPFTRRRTVSQRTETPEEMLAGFRAIADTLRDPWEQQRPLVTEIRKALEKEAAENGPWNKWRAREDIGWYLRELDMHAQIIDLHIKEGNASWAANEGALFGALWAELELKLAREDLYLRGLDDREAKSRGGGWNRKATREQKLAAYRHFRAAGNGKSDATYLAAKELGVSESNIREARKSAGASD